MHEPPHKSCARCFLPGGSALCAKPAANCRFDHRDKINILYFRSNGKQPTTQGHPTKLRPGAQIKLGERDARQICSPATYFFNRGLRCGFG